MLKIKMLLNIKILKLTEKSIKNSIKENIFKRFKVLFINSVGSNHELWSEFQRVLTKVS